jgi:hypothetical protein
MSGQFYDNAQNRTYTVLAASLIGGAAILQTMQGPAGKIGRVRGIEYLLTTGITVAASTITVGANGAVAPAVCSAEVAAIATGGAMTAAELRLAGAKQVAGVNDVELAADTPFEIATGGEATAGAGNIVVSIDWF